LISLLFLGLIVAWLGFGEQGLIHLYRTEMERQAYVNRIRHLADENRALLEETNRLRTDIGYVESVARKQLHLIKPGEVIYRFNKDKACNNSIATALQKAQQVDKIGKPKREVRHDGKIN